MPVAPSSKAAAALGRGVVSGLAGTAAMTAFQKLVEVPRSGRTDSFAPAAFAERVLPIPRRHSAARRRLNGATHVAPGTTWGGGAFAVASRVGLRGQRAVGVVLPAVHARDLLLDTALGLYAPSSWSKRAWLGDVVDKVVQAEATGAVFDRLSSSGRPSPAA